MHNVHPSADNDPFKLSIGAHTRFEKRTSHLLASEQKVVGPFETQLRIGTSEFLDGMEHSESIHIDQVRRIDPAFFWSYDRRPKEIPLASLPRSAVPTAPLSLTMRPKDSKSFSTLLSETLRIRVRALCFLQFQYPAHKKVANLRSDPRMRLFWSMARERIHPGLVLLDRIIS
jgi:hypothetical protein